MAFIPTTFELALGMLIVSAIGWGTAFATMRKCGNWRFEAWYVFWMIGSFLFVFLLTMTLGQTSAPTFLDTLSGAETPHILYALLSGIVWNLGNILLVAAIVLVGFGLGFPVAVGITMILGTTMSYFVNPTADPFFLFLGVSLILGAIIFNSISYRLKEISSKEKRNSNVKKGILVGVVSGLLMALFPFLLSLSVVPTGTLDGYGIVFLFTLGGLVSTFPYIYIFMKRPVTGEKRIGMKEILRAKSSWYVWAVVGGLIWAVATVFNFVTASVVSVSVAYSLGSSAPIISAILGVFVFKELKNAPRKSWIFIILMFAFFVAGLTSLTLSFG